MSRTGPLNFHSDWFSSNRYVFVPYSLGPVPQASSGIYFRLSIGYPANLKPVYLTMSYNPPLHPTAPNSAPFLAAHSDPTLTAALNDLTFGGITPSPSPELTAPLPTVDSLSALQRVLPLQADATHLPWIRDVLFLTERLNVQGLHDPRLRSLATAAASALLRILSGPEPHPPEAFYLRGLFHLNGAALEWVQKDHRNAFRDFELAATRGWAKAWFRLGRDYEIANDVPRARDCFERGMQADSEACIYVSSIFTLIHPSLSSFCSVSGWPSFSANSVISHPPRMLSHCSIVLLCLPA